MGVRVADDGSYGVLVEVNIETDFAARNDKFVAFVARVRDLAFERRTSDVAALMADRPRSGAGSAGPGDRREHFGAPDFDACSRRPAAKSRAICTRTTARPRWLRWSGGDDELGRDLAMHVTAINPMVVSGDDVAADVVEKEREIYTAQAQDSGKPADIIAKMVEGRVRKFLAEVSLLEQPFVKDANVRVGQLLTQKKARCTGFVRFEVGEGIDKVEKRLCGRSGGPGPRVRASASWPDRSPAICSNSAVKRWPARPISGSIPK